MSIPLDSSAVRIDGRLMAIALAFLCAGLIAVGAVMEGQPLVALAAVLAVPAAVSVLARPDATIPVVLFLIYSNAMVVAVHFHGVPSIAAMLAPAPLIIPLLYNIVLLRQRIVLGPALPWILAFVGWQLLSAMFSRAPDQAIEGVMSTVFEGLLMYVLITNVVRSSRILRTSVWALIAAGTFMGGISVYQQTTRSFDSDLGGFGQLSDGAGFQVAEGHGTVIQQRLSGPIGEKNRYAQVMLMLIPLALSRFWIERNFGLRSVAMVSAMLIAMGCALTFSRSGAIAFVLMSMVGLALKFVSPKQVGLLGIGGLVLLLAVPQYRTRLATVPTALGIFGASSTQEEPDGAIRGRVTEMLAAARMAIDHPVFGVGPDMSGEYTREYGQVGGLRALEGPRQTHCMFLEIPAETGLPGMMLFLSMLGATILSLLRTRSQIIDSDRELEQTVSAFLLALTGYLVMGIFLHMSYVRYFWLMLSMSDAATCVARMANKRTTPDAQEAVA